MGSALLGCLLLLVAPRAPAQVVCIDPGHPSENGLGSRGKVLQEVDVAWRVGEELRKRLEAAGLRVVMTRSVKDKTVTNKRRAEIANEAKADLMVRLHCDANSGTGFAVYYPDRAGKAGGATGPSANVIRQSKLAAVAFHQVLGDTLAGILANRGLHTDRATNIGGKQGALTGSVFSKVPVLLVEMLVLTNPKDEAFAASPKGISTLAEALKEGTLAALAKLGKGLRS